MLIKLLKYFFIILVYQTPLYSKNNILEDLNHKHLSNYFSGVIAHDNNDNRKALKFFQTSRILIDQHETYLKKYFYSLVLEGKVQFATNEIKQNITKKNSNFFEAYLILALDSLRKKNYSKSENYLKKSSNFINNDRFSLIIYETLKEYLYVFKEKKILKTKKKFGNLSFINEVFQRCYLDDQNTEAYYDRLINNENSIDYSRYIFFYINYLIQNDRYQDAKIITDDLDYLNSPLIISQTKKWIEEKKFNEFKKIFSCKDQNDLISEFFFLVGNLYSSNNDYRKSNFYLNLSNFFNPRFKFNLSLLAENYYFNDEYEETKNIIKQFDEKNDFYFWFKLKKEAQIISKKKDDASALDYLNKEFKKINNPSIKMIYDIANFNKNSKKYKLAIDYYNKIISKIDITSNYYSEILYRRGSSYERLGDYSKSDEDLLKSLEIDPDDAYVLNYLAYSWLERDFKINTALSMLEKAYAEENEDPYIIDSIGWAYYLIGDYIKAEKFIKMSVELMPQDPTVNDHYGDILWKLDRKIQARYFWKNALVSEEAEDKIKKNIKRKLIIGL
ncbi:tetratricopeptide repeat protein [bacterium]|nr:tetratricopeptide repeat protein [bacterium]